MTPLTLVFLAALIAPSQASTPAKSGMPMRSMPDQNLTADAFTCYTIRSYNFERRDGKAPELVGETTCTPALKSGPQQARKRVMRRPMLIPLKLDGSGSKE
jgi:hypothetical protein